MTIDVAGRTRTIEATRAGEGWLLRVDGRTWTASVAACGDRWSVLYAPAGSAVFESREVIVERSGGPGGGPDGAVHVDGRVVPVSWTARPAVARAEARSDAGWEMRAPMPGRVVRVLVEPGQPVQAGQGLVVVEAMKMENELRAPAAGIVRDVRVKPGTLVDARALLLVIEP